MAKQRPAPARAPRKKTLSARTTNRPKPPGRPSPPPEAKADAPASRRPTFYEAIALYETGVRALQRHDFDAAADHFRAVIQRYPEERELLERARLYLRVCERETANRPQTPRSVQERVYAATVALNAGNRETALTHLRQALQEDPDSDHAHYILAVALSETENRASALEHLRRAVRLNPENRPLALQDPDLAPLRELPEFREVVDLPQDAGRSRQKQRR